MPDWAESILRAAGGAFFGAAGFAMLVHVPKRAWLSSGCIAALSYLLYWGLGQWGIPDPMAVFVGSMFGATAGLFCARRKKIIGTVFLMSAVVPVVPGLGLYRMMVLLGQGHLAAGAEIGISAMITVAMIALGLGAGAYADRLLWERHLLSPRRRAGAKSERSTDQMVGREKNGSTGRKQEQA